MDWTALQTALKAWVLALLGWSATRDVVIFENEPWKRDNRRVAVLSWVSGAPVAAGEVRYEDTGALAPAPDLEPVTIALDVLALQIALETDDQRPQGPHARAFAQTLRARLWRPSSLDALDAMNLGLIGSSAITQADYREKGNGRLVSRTIVEVRFNASSFDRDALAAAGSIESAEVTSHVDTAAGAPVATPLQMNAEEIP